MTKCDTRYTERGWDSIVMALALIDAERDDIARRGIPSRVLENLPPSIYISAPAA